MVKLTHMEKDYDEVKYHILFLEINTTVAREHVSEIERELRQIKERMICTSSKFPFQFIPTMVLINTVYNVGLWLNTFLLRSGITGRFSPREIVTG